MKTFMAKFTTSKFKPFAIQAWNAQDAAVSLMVAFPDEWKHGKELNVAKTIEVLDSEGALSRFPCNIIVDEALRRLPGAQAKRGKVVVTNCILPGWERLVE